MRRIVLEPCHAQQTDRPVHYHAPRGSAARACAIGFGADVMERRPVANPGPAAMHPVSDRQIAAYSVAAFATMSLSQPVLSFVPQLYAKEFGLSLAGLGAVLFFGRIFDAVTDQVIGYLSDRTRSRWGARKPWVVAGATVTVIAAFFLLKPPPGIGLLYFFVWRLVYDIAADMQNLSYTAWGAELSDDYNTRSRVVIRRRLERLGRHAPPAEPGL